MTRYCPTVPDRNLSTVRPATRSGFTLIELLMVIAVILILAGITFGISRGVQNAQARAKAKAELSMIAQALEQFKLTYGDYPWIAGDPTEDANADANGNALLEALTGWKVLSASGGTPELQDVAADDGPKQSFIDPTKLTTNTDYPSGKPSNIRFLDPWGKPYAYVYGKTAGGGTWQNFGYILFSLGADGEHERTGFEAATGIIDPATYRTGKNTDNIFEGE